MIVTDDKEEQRMELRVLRYFLAVAREQNITHAAEVLHITQPTLSHHMKILCECYPPNAVCG